MKPAAPKQLSLWWLLVWNNSQNMVTKVAPEREADRLNLNYPTTVI